MPPSMIDTYIDSLPPELALSLRAVSVPHWWTVDALQAVLEIPLSDANRLYVDMLDIPFVRQLDDSRSAVHDLVRNQVAADLWEQDISTYRVWSQRLARHFGELASDSTTPIERIESIYHSLIADPDQGADEVLRWGAIWQNGFQYQYVFGLVEAGLEHDRAGRLQGRARGWIHYREGFLHLRGGNYQAARASWELAMESATDDLQLKANCLQGLGAIDLFEGNLEAAVAHYHLAHEQFLAISAELSAANCLLGLGDVYLKLPDLAQAIAYFEQAGGFYDRLGSVVGRATSSKGLGDALYLSGKYDAAEIQYLRAKGLFQSAGA